MAGETQQLLASRVDVGGDRQPPPAGVAAPAFKPTATRYWILFSFSLIGMCQCMNCFTLTSLPDSAEQYFRISQSELIVIFNWQPLANTVGALFAAGLYSTLGTKWTARLLAVLATLGPTLRCVASERTMATEQRKHQLKKIDVWCPVLACWRVKHAHGYPSTPRRCVPSLVPSVLASRPLRLLCLHGSSIVNGLGGPILNTAPALLSAIWFPANERMTGKIALAVYWSAAACSDAAGVCVAST